MKNRCLSALVALGLFTGAAQTQDQAANKQPAANGGNQVAAQQFDQWYYRCVEASEGKTVSQCEVAQIAQVDQNGKKVNVLTLALAKANDANGKINHVMTVLAPLNVALPVGFGLGVDDAQPQVFGYRNCNQAGCWVVVPLDDKLMGKLKRGNVGVGRIRLMNGQNVNIRFSLNGFTKAVAALDEGKAPVANQ